MLTCKTDSTKKKDSSSVCCYVPNNKVLGGLLRMTVFNTFQMPLMKKNNFDIILLIALRPLHKRCALCEKCFTLRAQRKPPRSLRLLMFNKTIHIVFSHMPQKSLPLFR
jgi:hypothetical protein